MKQIRILLLSGIALLGACNKKENTDTVIHGQVVDFDTRQPVSGMPVLLEFLDGDSGMGLNLGSYKVGETVTDANGNYSFDFLAGTDNSAKDRYRLTSYGSDNQFGFGAEPASMDIDRKATTLDFESYPKIGIDVKLVHQGAQNPSDNISLVIYRFPYDNGTSELVYGYDAVYNYHNEVVPGHPTVFRYTIRRNGVYQPERTDSVTFNNRNETYTIEY